jgi:hypothetical protein
MNKAVPRYLKILIGLLVIFPVLIATADCSEEDTPIPDYKWLLTIYGGISAQDTLGDVLSFQATFPDDVYIGVVALARELWRYKHLLGIEAEGQVGKYFGDEHQWQFNGLLIGRWHKFPWDHYLNTSLAIGEGLSYNTEVSDVEERDDEDATKLLNYLLFELTLGLPSQPRWDFVVRIHHRSSIKGVIGAAGSNFVCAGIKIKFP